MVAKRIENHSRQNKVCPAIHKVRVRPAIRSAVATC